MYENFQDMQLSCADCGQTFTFTAEEQEFYASKGFSSPRRCSVCRANRKMGGSSRGAGRSNKPMYDVTCSNCGCQTTVPFQPKDDRPVYCSDCYRKQY